MMVAIIDYDAGNLRSVEKALLFLGEKPVISRDPKVLLSADHVILPGVGSFGEAMDKLNRYDLVSVLHEVADRNIPLLGICLGLQLFFDYSEESPGVEGLHLMEGAVKRIPRIPEDLKIPHMGWNSLHFDNPGRLFKGINEGAYVYFVHSYYLEAGRPESVTASSFYGTNIHASVESGNIFGCQFHPEKSSEIGLKILSNFINVR